MATVNPIAADACDIFDQIKPTRSTWDGHWQEIAERVWPRKSDNFFGAPGANVQHGAKKTKQMYDATAALGLERFAAAMESMLTPRSSQWHRLLPTDRSLMKHRRAVLWYEELNRVLFQYRYSPRANYASQAHENYMGLGAFGTSALFIDEAVSRRGFRYRAIELGETYFIMNHEGFIDTVYREMPMSGYEMSTKWPAEMLPQKVIKALNSNKPLEQFTVLHVIRPRDNYQPDRIGKEGMPWQSLYIFLDDKELISEGGYYTFPMPVSRYVTGVRETYGRSPAMLALPAIMTINEQKKTVLKQGHRVVDPVLLGHDDGVIDTFDLTPGTMNAGAMTKDGKRLVDVLPTGNIAVGKDMMDQEREVINDAFLVTLFQILTDNPRMTATEVLERAQEKGALLSPTMGRQQSEMLGPQIEREVDIAIRQGLIGEPPPEVIEAGAEYDVEYDSPLSRAQKAEEAAGLFRYMDFATVYAQSTGDQSPFDHIDIDEVSPEMMTINAVPEKWKREGKAVETLRKVRAEQQQIQQAIEAAPAAAGVMKAAQ